MKRYIISKLQVVYFVHGIYRVAKLVDPGAIPFNIPVFPLLPRLAIKTSLPHRISPVDPSLAACVPGTTFSLWWMLLSQHLIVTAQLRNDHQNQSDPISDPGKGKGKK